MPWPAVVRAWLDAHWWVPLVAVAPLALWLGLWDVGRDKRIRGERE